MMPVDSTAPPAWFTYPLRLANIPRHRLPRDAARTARRTPTRDTSMSQAPSRYWKDMTSAEFDSLDKGRAIAVLPLAAIEQHGPHLPVSVDVCINTGIIDRAVELLPEDLPAVFLPCLEIGLSIEHVAFSGTLSLTAESAMRYWLDVGASIHRAGVRKLVLFNSHGGNPPVVGVVARGLRVRRGI